MPTRPSDSSSFASADLTPPPRGARDRRRRAATRLHNGRFAAAPDQPPDEALDQITSPPVDDGKGISKHRGAAGWKTASMPPPTADFSSLAAASGVAIRWVNSRAMLRRSVLFSAVEATAAVAVTPGSRPIFEPAVTPTPPPPRTPATRSQRQCAAPRGPSPARATSLMRETAA